MIKFSIGKCRFGWKEKIQKPINTQTEEWILLGKAGRLKIRSGKEELSLYKLVELHYFPIMCMFQNYNLNKNKMIG